MATPTKPNNRLGTYVLKTIKDESFRAYVPPPLPPDPPLALQRSCYLSLYFKTNRQKYYKLLDRVRTQGDWET